MTNAVVRLLRFASIAICLIVIASFVTFAVQQTKTASGHQQEEVATGGLRPNGGEPPPPSKPHKGAVHKALDEASDQFTSPFDGLLSGSNSEWAKRGAKLVLALLLYGFGLGFVARVLRVRV